MIFDDDSLDYFTLIGDFSGNPKWNYEYEENNLRMFKVLCKIFRKLEEKQWEFTPIYFKKLTNDEKKYYDYEDTNFRKKYTIMAKLEAFYNVTLYVKKNVEKIYPLSFSNQRTINFKKCIYIFEKKLEYFLGEIKKLDFYKSKNDEYRLKKMENLFKNVLIEIQSRKKQQSLLFFLPFYKGNAEPINIYGLKQEIMDFIL